MNDRNRDESVFLLSSALSPMYRAGTFPACHSARPGSCSVHCVAFVEQLSAITSAVLFCFVLKTNDCERICIWYWALCVVTFSVCLSVIVESKKVIAGFSRAVEQHCALLGYLRSKQCQFLADVSVPSCRVKDLNPSLWDRPVVSKRR